jgi:hypothetical protein
MKKPTEADRAKFRTRLLNLIALMGLQKTEEAYNAAILFKLNTEGVFVCNDPAISIILHLFDDYTDAAIEFSLQATEGTRIVLKDFFKESLIDGTITC